MTNAWFRMYHEFATDPKVQMLSETDQRRYIMLLCLRCSNADVTLHETEVAFQLRISNEEYAETKRVLIEKGLLTEDNQPTAWDKRQYKSDSSAARVAAHRERKKQQCNVTVTKSNALDTDTDTDTDTDIKKKDKKKPKTIFHPPSEIDPVLWARYLVSRKEKKHPMNAASLELAAAAIMKTSGSGHSVEKVMTIMIEAGWRTVKTDWINNLENGENAISGSNGKNGKAKAKIDPNADFDIDPWAGWDEQSEEVGNNGVVTIEGHFQRVEGCN